MREELISLLSRATELEHGLETTREYIRSKIRAFIIYYRFMDKRRSYHGPRRERQTILTQFHAQQSFSLFSDPFILDPLLTMLFSEEVVFSCDTGGLIA
jgi:hypothetical protein